MSPDGDRRWKALPSAVLLTFGACLMLPFGDLAVASNVPLFLAGASVAAFGYLRELRRPQLSGALFWAPLVAARLVLLWSPPGADIYRYIWEGTIQLHGHIPYCSAPSAPEIAHLRNSVWELVEHKDVSAIYPPGAELGFAVLAAVSQSVAFFKLTFLVADLAICALLARRFGYGSALVYGWNPLVIYSAAGGGHYDSWFVLAMVGAWLAWERRSAGGQGTLAAAALAGLGIALKWLSLPLLGWLGWRVFREDGPGKAAATLGMGLAPFAVCWALVNRGLGHCAPFPADFAGLARSAELLPAIVSPFLPSQYRAAHNEIYAYLFAAICVLLILRCRSYQGAAQSTLVAAFITTPMFHAWYATWLMPFAAFRRSRAAIAFSLSSFVYFWLHYRVGQPDGIWRQSAAGRLLLWGPLIGGLAWDWLASARYARRATDPSGAPGSPRNL